MSHTTSTQRIGWLALAIYGVSIVLANWLIRNVGTIVIPGGTHLVPVGFGQFAPSGVYAAGLTFVCRDVVQRTIGRRWSLLVIIPGALLTGLLDVHLAIASAGAFLFSELTDYLVYTPLQRRGLVRAVFASTVAASVIDSLIFLTLAGIPLQAALAGQLIGKWEVALITIPVILLLRAYLARLSVHPSYAPAPASAPASATVRS